MDVRMSTSAVVPRWRLNMGTHMKRYLAAMLITTAAGTANAADLPMKTPRAPAPRVVSDWTGFYIGAHGGYGWARPEITDFDLNHSSSLDTRVTPVHTPKLRGTV